MYVIGGDPQCTGEVLDIGALKWEHLPGLITPRSGHRVGIAKDRIICAGGMDSSGSLLRSVEVRECWLESSVCACLVYFPFKKEEAAYYSVSIAEPLFFFFQKSLPIRDSIRERESGPHFQDSSSLVQVLV